MSVRIGIIGVGAITADHLEAIRLQPDCEIVGVCRRTRAEVESAARELACRPYTEYRELLAAQPDIVLVSLPHGMHCDVVCEAMEAGCHVMVEKPMAVSVAQCNRMLWTARRLGRHLRVAETGLANTGALRTGEKFRQGKLGRFFAGSIMNERFYFHEGRPAWFLDPETSGGGMFSNVGVHRLAIARTALPGIRPVTVSASVSRLSEYRVEACTSALVRYDEGGSMVYEEVGYYPRPPWLNTGTHFIFQEGIVTWDERAWRIQQRKGDAFEEPLEASGPAYGPIYGEMLRALGGESDQSNPAGCALDVVISQAAYASSREGREIDLREASWRISA